MEAVGQLTGGIAHDFNNLLTVIIGNLDIVAARSSQRATRDGRSRIGRAARPGHARRAARGRADPAAARLLAPPAARAQAGRRQPPGRRHVRPAAPHARRARSRSRRCWRGGLWPTLADPNQLENAVLNLAVNARDAMPDGGQLTIETANAYLDETYVAAHGRGRARPVRADRRHRHRHRHAARRLGPRLRALLHHQGAGKGTGLGLRQVYGFVKQSGGHVRIYSEVGQRHDGQDLSAAH